MPVGTEYHWYILAHQTARKLKWSASGPTQRKHLVAFFKDVVAQLEKDPVAETCE